MSVSVDDIIRVLGFVLMALVARHTGSVALGLIVGFVLLLLGELLWVRRRLGREGVLEDERERALRLKAVYASLMLLVVAAGLLALSSLLMEEYGVLELSAYASGLRDGAVMTVFFMLLLAWLARLYYERVPGEPVG